MFRDLKILRGAEMGASGGTSLDLVAEGVFECFHHGGPRCRAINPSRLWLYTLVGKEGLGCILDDDTGSVCTSGGGAVESSMGDVVTGLVCTRGDAIQTSPEDDVTASVCTSDDMAGMFMVDVLTGSVCMSDCTIGTLCTTGGAICRFCITVEEADMLCMPDSAPVRS